MGYNEITREAQQQNYGKYVNDGDFDRENQNYIITLPDIYLIANNINIAVPVPNINVHPANAKTGEQSTQRKQSIAPPGIQK